MTHDDLKKENEILRGLLAAKDDVNKRLGLMIAHLERLLKNAGVERANTQ